jgi:hypothetical protein
MRTKLSFWLENHRLAMFWIDSSILANGSRVDYGYTQIKAAATASQADHFELINPVISFLLIKQ